MRNIIWCELARYEQPEVSDHNMNFTSKNTLLNPFTPFFFILSPFSPNLISKYPVIYPSSRLPPSLRDSLQESSAPAIETVHRFNSQHSTRLHEA